MLASSVLVVLFQVMGWIIFCVETFLVYCLQF